jgi:group I intron endonuclease
MFIYKITNKINGKFYIGKTSKSVEQRFKAHINCAKNRVNRHLYDAMNYYGYDNFTVELIEEIYSNLEANEKERYWINFYNCISPKGYNMTVGGDGGYTLENWDESSRSELYKKQAKTRTGMKRTPEQKKNFSAAAKKREAEKTEEQKLIISKKISETHKKLGLSPPEDTKWKKGQIGTRLGILHTNKTKQKLSVARKGKTYEDIMPIELVKAIKTRKSDNWKSEKNPNYVEFTKDNKLTVLYHLKLNPNTPLKELVIIANTNSKGSKISSFLKECGIKNLQKFRRFSNEEQQIITSKAIDYVNENY